MFLEIKRCSVLLIGCCHTETHRKPLPLQLLRSLPRLLTGSDELMPAADLAECLVQCSHSVNAALIVIGCSF